MKTNTGAILVAPPTAPTTTNVAVGEDIRDIKGPVDIPVGWVWLAWTLGALIVAVAVFFLVRRWLRRRRAAAVPQVIIPPHVRARARLNAALRLLYDPKPFCIEVSDTVRWYLEERFQYRAPERTTDEFLDELQASPLLSLTQKQSLADFLSRCDLVKFARYEPTETELRSLHDSALRLVDETSWGVLAGPTTAAAGAQTAGLPVPAATSPAVSAPSPPPADPSNRPAVGEPVDTAKGGRVVITEDLRSSAAWISQALRSSGYGADFSPGSLWEIDRFFEEQSEGGAAKPGGLLAQDLGARLFALGAYIGEVVRRHQGGRWVGNDSDPEAEINVELHLPDGTRCWPVQRVMKRFKNGAEDGIAGWGHAAGLPVGPRPSMPK